MLYDRSRLLLAGAGAVLALALGVALGRLTSTSATAAPAAIEMKAGVPIGVEHTRAGALAAADNYLAFSSQNIEQDPTLFAALVRSVYAPGVRTKTLREAAEVRASDPLLMSNYRGGGHGIALIGARGIEQYSPSSATVRTWLGGVVWGPALRPRQSWNVILTTLLWRGGRWLISASSAQSTPAPVPSIVYVEAHNNQSGAFDRGLAGMSAPFYGAG